MIHVTDLDGKRYSFAATAVTRIEKATLKSGAGAVLFVDQPPRALLTRESTEDIAAQLRVALAHRPKRRDDRQAVVYRWCVDTFGERNATPPERAWRLFEEAAELCQAEGVTREQLMDVVAHVYDKPVGEPAQEVGGIGVTLLAYCGAKGLSAEAEEAREAGRVLSKDPDHFRDRHNKKAAAGVAHRVEPSE